MKNELARLLSIAVSTAVLSSLLTWSIFVGLMPMMEGGEIEGVQMPEQVKLSAFQQLELQVAELLNTPQVSEKKTDLEETFASSRTLNFLQNGMSDSYLTDAVRHKNGYAEILPYTANVARISLSEQTLRAYPAWFAQPWETNEFTLSFTPAQTIDDDFVSSSLTNNQGFALELRQIATRMKPVADCQGDYPQAVKDAATFFKTEFFDGASVENLCQFIEVSEPLSMRADEAPTLWGADQPITTLAPAPVRAYTLRYALAPYKDGNGQPLGLVPVLPTLFLRDEVQNPSISRSGTLAVWKKVDCSFMVDSPYGHQRCSATAEQSDAVNAAIEKLNKDLTTKTVVQMYGCGYEYCY